jgi:hypothetical protein
MIYRRRLTRAFLGSIATVSLALAAGYRGDPELFWVVKNGIRLTGMPGFGRFYSDPQIWHLVRYIRTLNPSPNAAKQTKQLMGAADLSMRQIISRPTSRHTSSTQKSVL